MTGAVDFAVAVRISISLHVLDERTQKEEDYSLEIQVNSGK